MRPRVQRLRKLARAAGVLARAAGTPSLLRLGLDRQGAVLQVENTTYCNYRCRYCATHAEASTLTIPRGHMTMETFARLLDAHPRARMVVIQGDGEPFLDPTVFDKIRLARRQSRVTQVVSNGSMLGSDAVERILTDGPDVLLFSIDAASPERVMAQRRGMRYGAIFSRVQALSQARARAARPMVLGLLSVVYGPFDAEVSAALRSFNALDVDVLFYKQLNAAYGNRIQGYDAPAIDGVPRHVARGLNYWVSHQRVATVAPCAWLRHDLAYYLWDGTRTPCCVMNHPQYAAPEYRHDRLLARWRERRLPSECERCSYFAGYPDRP